LLTVDIKRIFLRFKDNGKAPEASWLPNIRPLGNKSVRGLSRKRQKSQQVSGVASAVPFLGETLPKDREVGKGGRKVSSCTWCRDYG